MAGYLGRWRKVLVAMLVAVVGSIGAANRFAPVIHGQTTASTGGSVTVGLPDVPRTLNPLNLWSSKGAVYITR